MKYVPAPTCICCKRTLKQVGGHRIAAAERVGIVIEQSRTERQQRGHTVIPLATPRNHQLRFWGKVLQDLTFGDIEAVLKDCQRPWICQQCAGVALCTKCGSPLSYAHGADILDDEGQAQHCMIVPASVSCTNSNCKDRRKNKRIKDDE